MEIKCIDYQTLITTKPRNYGEIDNLLKELREMSLKYNITFITAKAINYEDN